MRCRFSPLAEFDLEEIGDRCFLILHTPQGSPLREDLDAGVRVAPFGRYLIFHTVHEDSDEVRVERILHSARDIDPGFFH